MSFTLNFRAASDVAFATNLNALCVANNLPPLFPDTTKLGNTVWETEGGVILARVDFAPDPPNALCFGDLVNVQVTEQQPNVEAALKAQVDAWFGGTQVGTSFPVCPGLTTFTNPQGVAPQVGGQKWPSTPAGTIYINPPPTNPRRTW